VQSLSSDTTASTEDNAAILGSEDIYNCLESLFTSFGERFSRAVSADVSSSLDLIGVLVLIDSLLMHAGVAGETDFKPSPHSGYRFPASLVVPKLLTNRLEAEKHNVLRRLDQFIAEQITWIQGSKGSLSDAKLLGISPAMCKFPYFMDLVDELTFGQVGHAATIACLPVLNCKL
jgi:hypothetical protein